MTKTFHVEYLTYWTVRTGKLRVSYPAWNKRVAISYAKSEAKKVKGKVVVHGRDGSEKEINFANGRLA